VADLDAAVGDGAAAIAWPSVPDRFRESPLVLTHGDPGPATSSTTKSLARSSTGRTRTSRLAASIWPGPSSSPWSGPDRYVAEEHASRARAVVAGFSGEGGAWAPDEEELTWWLAVAGAQFAHRRLQRAGEPGVLPWAEALTVLDDVLRNDSTAALLATA
jgi:hypothetical protein